MGKADGLSRRSDWKVSTEKYNKNQISIKDQQLYSLSEVVMKEPEVDILKKIKIARNKNKKVVRIVEEMKKAGVKVQRREEWQIEGDLVLKEGKVYVLKDEVLRVEIIQLHYDILVAGHGEKWKMVELVTRNNWWLGVTKDVGKYVEKCDMY